MLGRWSVVALLVSGLVPALAAQAGAPVDPGQAVVPTDIQTVIAETTAEIAALQQLRQSWAAEDKAAEQRLHGTVETVLLLESQLADAKRGSPEAEAVFDRTKLLVRAALDSLWTVIHAAGAPRQFASIERRAARSAGRLGAAERPAPGSQAAGDLERLEARERSLESELARLEVERRIDAIEGSLDLGGRIWQLRIESLAALPLARKREVYSFEGEGREELEVELEAMRIVTEVQRLRLRGAWTMVKEGLFGFISALRLGTLAVKLLSVLLLWRWLQANRERYLQGARARVATIADPLQRQRAQGGVEFLAAIAPWAIFLIGVNLLRWSIGSRVTGLPGVKLTLVLLLVYGIYRLLSDVAVGLLADSMSRAGIEVSGDLKKRFETRARWVIRVGMVGLVLTWMVAARIGDGLLYAHLRALTWLAVVMALFLAVGGLKEEIADLFLAVQARGRMASLVRRTRGKLIGRVVAPIAFVWLVALSVVNLLRGLAYSLDSTRAATAYVARRRLQKSAESGGYASGRLEDLPPGLVEDLDPTVRVDDLVVLDRFAGLDVCRRAIAVWREGEGGGSFLLAGDEGVGKRAWVSHLAEIEGTDLRIEPPRRIMNGKALIRWLSRDLLGEDELLSRAELVSKVEQAPMRIILIERAERLFLTTVNGYNALAELGPIVDATRHKLFWLVSIEGLAFQHLTAARKDLAFLRRQHWLDSWDEQSLRQLVSHRLARSGLKVDYSNLVSGGGRHEDREARDRQGRQAYSSLLWDFCGGNPQVALYYYLRSLEPDRQGVLRARPFVEPNEGELEAMDESALFILAAVARHGSLTPREAALATNYDVGRVHGRLVRLRDLAVVAASDAGAYRVTTKWRSTVLKLLRRHNILMS